MRGLRKTKRKEIIIHADSEVYDLYAEAVVGAVALVDRSKRNEKGARGAHTPSDEHSDACHDLPHDDSERVHVTRPMKPLLPDDLGGDVERCAVVDVASVAVHTADSFCLATER